jgi:DNA-binding phage protein
MKTPSIAALRFAAEWLRAYDEDDNSSLEEVADWLEEQATAAYLREMARKHGVSVEALRKALSKQSKG